ncbi:MAG: S41 family peptidase [Pyrinomonadaceae bacterium]
MKDRSALFSCALLLAFFVSQAFSQNNVAGKITPGKNKETNISKTSAPPVTIEKIESDVAQALTVIQDNYVVGKKLDYNELFKTSIDSMLHTLDPHSNYFDAKEFEQFRTDQSSQYFGIGATITDWRDENGKLAGTFIRATFDNAPANRAGLRYGDKIVEINGVSMLGKPFAEVRKSLIGPRGTIAKLIVERYGTGKREPVEIVRDAVPQPSIPQSYMIRPGVGFIQMSGGFNQTTYNEFRQDLADLKAQGMQNLILDLRDNGGGLVNQAYQVANTFLSAGQTIFTQKGRLGGTADPFSADNKNPDKTPIVMLVNRNTASASEILAGALQDHDRALIVGENSFGKGLVQNPFLIEYGSMLLLTIAKYETPSGRLIQRDYSNGNLYDYYTKGGSFADDDKPLKPSGAESKTDTGRIVYSGGGIQPDVLIKPATITGERGRMRSTLNDPIFAFSLNLAFGKIPGYETYKVNRPIVYNHDLNAADFPITENVFQAFKKFAVGNYKISPALVDRERVYSEQALRAELVTAAYGTTTSYQISNETDNQITKSIELLPRAQKLEMDSVRVNEQKKTTGINR